MVTRSIVGRFLILAILIVAVGVVSQAALIITEGGNKPVRMASAPPISTPKPADADSPAADPVRIVYPGPLGDTAATKPKLTDAATASPLAAPATQPTAKLAQAMSGSAAPAPEPEIPAPASTLQPVLAPPAAASVETDPSPTSASQPAPAEVAAVPQSVPETASAAPASQAAPAPKTQVNPAPAGVEVASLGGGTPQADAPPAGGVNINTASVAALNRLGGGHIGESIAKHRPYRSVEELVRKRVLRRSVFDQIRNEIAAR